MHANFLKWTALIEHFSSAGPLKVLSTTVLNSPIHAMSWWELPHKSNFGFSLLPKETITCVIACTGGAGNRTADLTHNVGSFAVVFVVLQSCDLSVDGFPQLFLHLKLK